PTAKLDYSCPDPGTVPAFEADQDGTSFLRRHALEVKRQNAIESRKLRDLQVFALKRRTVSQLAAFQQRAHRRLVDFTRGIHVVVALEGGNSGLGLRAHDAIGGAGVVT